VDRDKPAGWKLVRCEEALKDWDAREKPDGDTRLLVASWVMSRHDDPYAGVRREPNFPNLWFGRIPDTDDEEGAVVTCSYFIHARIRVVQCNMIARLSPPL
jgi:hypothetical protein